MIWLFASVISYFFFAVASIFDRLVLVGSSATPRIYAFYVGILGGVLGLALIPFIGFYIPPVSLLFISLSAGVVFVFFILTFFISISRLGVSRTTPAIGGFAPIFTLFIGFVLLGQEVVLSPLGFLAFALFIIAGVILSRKDASISEGVSVFSLHTLLLLLGAAFFLALYIVLLKMAFTGQSFLEGFAWVRIGSVIPAIGLIFSKEVRNAAFKRKTVSYKQFFIPFVGAQIFGSAGVIFHNLSIFWASAKEVALVPALVGLQYIFLYGFMIILYRWRPNLLKEVMGGKTLRKKFFAAALIAIGLVTLAFSS